MTKPKHDVKRFAYSEIVEVQREPGSEWEDAIYRGKIVHWRGWHTVQLRAQVERYEGGTRFTRGPMLSLPTKRIRAKKTP